MSFHRNRVFLAGVVVAASAICVWMAEAGRPVRPIEGDNTSATTEDHAERRQARINDPDVASSTLEPASSREEIVGLQLVVEVRLAGGEPCRGCDVLLCRGGPQGAWESSPHGSIAFRDGDVGSPRLLPAVLFPPPQDRSSPVAMGISNQKGYASLTVPRECAWGTVWCQYESNWFGLPWTAPTGRAVLVVPEQCELRGRLIDADGYAVQYPEGAHILAQNVSSGAFYSGVVEPSGRFRCAGAVAAKHVMRLVGAGDWQVEYPTKAVDCDGDAQIRVARQAHTVVATMSGQIVRDVEVIVTEAASGDVMSRRRGWSQVGRHQVWQNGIRKELQAFRGDVTVRSAGFVSATVGWPHACSEAWLEPGDDPALTVLGAVGDEIAVNYGSSPDMFGPLSLLGRQSVGSSGEVHFSVPSDVRVTVTARREGEVVGQKTLACDAPARLDLRGHRLARIRVEAGSVWAASVQVVHEGGSRHDATLTEHDVWSAAGVEPGWVCVLATPSVEHFGWRAELGFRSGKRVKLVAGEEAVVRLVEPPPSGGAVRVVGPDGAPVARLRVTDARDEQKTTDMNGRVENWPQLRAPLSAMVGVDRYLPLWLVRGQDSSRLSDGSVFGVDLRWAEGLAPVRVLVDQGGEFVRWKSLEFRSAARHGVFVAYCVSDSADRAWWPVDAGAVNVVVSLESGVQVLADNVLSEAGEAWIRIGSRREVPLASANVSLWVYAPMRSSGLSEPVVVTAFSQVGDAWGSGPSEQTFSKTGTWCHIATSAGKKRVRVLCVSDGRLAEWVGAIEVEGRRVRVTWEK